MSTETTTPPTLSERELQVLRLVATGATNIQIARDLQISVNTVKVHLNNIFSKLGVQSRTEAALYAVRLGWVDVPRPEPLAVVGAGAIASGPPTAQDATARETAASPASSPSAPVATQLPATAIPQPWPRRRRVLVGMLAAGLLAGLIFYPLASSTDAWRSYFGPPVTPGAIRLPPRWVAKAPLPSARDAMGVTALGGLVYAIGGADDGRVLNDLSVYDPARDVWSSKAPKPTAVQGAGAVVISGRVYVPGGCDAENHPTAGMEVYDPSRDTWQAAAPLPKALCFYAISAVEGKLYLFGGWDGSAEVASVLVYDPARAEWSERSSLPTPRADAEAAVLNDRIYVVGGRQGERVLSETLVFDPAQAPPDPNAWSSKAPMQHARARFGLVSLAGNLYALSGGWSADLAENERYDSQANAWSPIESSLQPLQRVGGAAAMETKIYTVGGWQGHAADGVEEYTALYRFFVPSMSAGQ